MTAVALDFGHTHTVVATWNGALGQAEPLLWPELGRPHPYNFLIPSRLYVRDGSRGWVVVGQPVVDGGYTLGDVRYFANLKRALLAAGAFAPEVDGVVVGPGVAGRWFCQRLLDLLAQRQVVPSELCLTVPVQASERYLRWWESWLPPGLPVRWLDEATAAALGYRAAWPGAVVLVVDWGGGTLDVSLVRLPRALPEQWGIYRQETEVAAERRAEVLAKTGRSLGGEDVTDWLRDEYLATLPPPVRASLSKEALHRLRGSWEHLKIQLTMAETAEMPWLLAGEMVTLRGDRAGLARVLAERGFWGVLRGALEEVLAQGLSLGVLKMDIQQVLLVGGTTLLPGVAAAVRQVFPHTPLHAHRPFDAVVCGALEETPADRLFHSYGLRYWNRQRQAWEYHILLRQGQTYPTPYPVELTLRAVAPQQKCIEIVLGEVETLGRGATEIRFEGDRPVVTVLDRAPPVFYPLLPEETPQAILPLDPPGEPESDRLHLQFRVDRQRRLCLTVRDLLTGALLMDGQAIATLR
ncbi:MAG: Hsp70 family protein [Pseudanabaenaceae cyanobacterium]